jgi:Xaa-Pro aminopeptidase
LTGTAPRAPYSRRLQALRDALPAAGVDALLVTHAPNLRYLAGFDGSTGALLVTASACTLVVDGRYATAATARVNADPELGDVAVAVAERSLEEAAAHLVMGGAPVWSLGVEAAAITLSRFDRLSELLGRAETAHPAGRAAPRLRATERLVEALRLVKDPFEAATLREAARRLSAVARGVPAYARPGRTERDVAADIDAAIRAAGFERPAFETIVASGPGSALPHARPGGRRLQPGDAVVLDFGGAYEGYCVDLTRTVQLAPATADFGRVFAAVRAAHAAALAAVRPGARASEVDAAARTALAAEGLADAFVHGTGHGLGLEVHEEPRIARAGTGSVDEVLRPGMVFTIEPGAYLPGRLGVRIEDDVLVTAEACDVLTDVPIEQAGDNGQGPAAPAEH